MLYVNDDLQQRWWVLEAKLAERFGKKPDLEAVLFLIGMQETGFMQNKITKEQKQDYACGRLHRAEPERLL